MASYAYVEDNSIVSIHDNLPQNWKNISNFYALRSDETTLNEAGWYTIIKTHIEDVPGFVRGEPQYIFKDSQAHEIIPLIMLNEQSSHLIGPSDEQSQMIHKAMWSEVRRIRDEKMREFEWRYVRYYREQRLGNLTTDDVNALDVYMQQLADITSTFQHPFDVVWPEWNKKE